MGKRKTKTATADDGEILRKAQKAAKRALKAATRAFEEQQLQQLQQHLGTEASLDLFNVVGNTPVPKKRRTKALQPTVDQLDEGLALLNQQQQAAHGASLLEELILQQQLEQNQLQMEQQQQQQQQLEMQLQHQQLQQQLLLPQTKQKGKRKESRLEADSRKKTQDVINAAVVAAAAVASAATQHVANASGGMLSGTSFQGADQWQQLMSENDHEMLQSVFAAAAQQAVNQAAAAQTFSANSADSATAVAAAAAASVFLPIDAGTMLARAAAAAAASEAEESHHRPKRATAIRTPRATLPQSAVMIPSADPINDTRILSQKYIKTLNVKGSQADALRATYNMGPFSNLEKHRIGQAVDSYLLEYSVPREDLHYLINRRTKFTAAGSSSSEFKSASMYADKKYSGFIASVRENAALNRTVDQVYWYMSRAYSTKRTGGARWTEEEDNMLRHLIATKGERYAEIEREMGRGDTKKRWKKLMSASPSMKVGRWGEDEVQKLTSAITQIMTREGLTDSSQITQWPEISSMVGTRNDVQCRSKWNLALQCGKKVLPTARSFEYDDYVALLTRMLALCSTANDETEIIWEMLVGHEEPWNAHYLKGRWMYLRGAVPAHEVSIRTFSQLIDYCFNNLVELMDRRSRMISTSEFLVNTEDMDA
ncbi:hypothetical protein BSLG_007009 [Batrachochytrium salamandrivorans]|nr:hypothetical protein BASA81_016232 [Batrachochytrium salamandrivorans]KAH9274589.1 hypothetical protein BASA83_003225 [Batrachochytrium salamandrivorans]KAJ1336690.1 hypothetical protein BSLG_007009 [Batrachochytrium salamandrivorans]